MNRGVASGNGAGRMCGPAAEAVTRAALDQLPARILVIEHLRSRPVKPVAGSGVMALRRSDR